jgi:hypothetical protein
MWFKRQLMEHGLKETEHKRVVSEPFSRYLRGIRPLHTECGIAFLKAFNLYDAFDRGETRIMPYYLGEHDLGIRPFEDLVTNNVVDEHFLPLIDRLNVPSLRQYVSCEFRDQCELPIHSETNRPARLD